jgi:hypothetical protein
MPGNDAGYKQIHILLPGNLPGSIVLIPYLLTFFTFSTV